MTANKPVISPLRLFLLTAACAFAAEALVMLVLPALSLDSLFSEAIVDALLLLLILVPFLYLWLYRPMDKEIRRRIEAENDLRSAHTELERLVAIRTADLSRAHAEISLTAQVFDNAEEGIVITDPEGNIQRTNSSFTRITGYDGDEVRGKNPRLLKSGHHQPEFYARMWAALKEKGGWHGEIFNRRKNGEVYPEWLSISAI
ncbi:MAG: PAS domain S-box protein, partial [Thermodesulfobacteriota bacterium]